VGGGFPLPADRFGGEKPNRAKRKVSPAYPRSKPTPIQLLYEWKKISSCKPLTEYLTKLFSIHF